MFNLNPELVTDLTVEQAAIVEGGFFKGIVNKQKQLLERFRPILRPGFPGVSPIGGTIARPSVRPLAGSIAPQADR